MQARITVGPLPLWTLLGTLSSAWPGLCRALLWEFKAKAEGTRGTALLCPMCPYQPARTHTR